VRAAWRDLLLPVLPAPPGRVADLGCGTGTLSLLLAEQGYAVDGIDFSPRMIQLARAKVGTRNEVRFFEGDAADPVDLGPPYDVVLSRHVLWSMPDPAAALGRWVELLAPDGRLLLVEGSWSTGAGLTAAATVSLLAEMGRTGVVRPLREPAYWGREITDERYLVVA